MRLVAKAARSMHWLLSLLGPPPLHPNPKWILSRMLLAKPLFSSAGRGKALLYGSPPCRNKIHVHTLFHPLLDFPTFLPLLLPSHAGLLQGRSWPVAAHWRDCQHRHPIRRPTPACDGGKPAPQPAPCPDVTMATGAPTATATDSALHSLTTTQVVPPSSASI